MLSSFRLKEPVRCPPRRQICLPGRSRGRLLLPACGHISHALEQQERLRTQERKRGPPRVGEEERAARRARVNAGEDKSPKLV